MTYLVFSIFIAGIVTVAGDPDRPTWESVAGLSGGSYQEVPAPDSPDLISAVSRLLD